MIRNLFAASMAALLSLLPSAREDTSSPPSAQATNNESSTVTRNRVLHAYGQLPLAFEANRGQTDPRVRYLARGLGYSLFLAPTEAVLSLPAAQGDAATVLRMQLVGANRDPEIIGQARQAGVSHYYRGADEDQWKRDVPRYGEVRYDEVYPGVDLIYYGNQNRLEYDFIVAPGRDPDAIVMAFDGPAARRIDAAGNLVLSTRHGELTQQRPLLYQDIDGQRVAVAGRYKLLTGNRVGFQVGRYDRDHALVIDPVLDYSGWLEASLNDWAAGIAVDRAGNVYLAGRTQSTDYPTTVVGDAPGPLDAFLTKINATGNALLYSAYIGSDFDDEASAIALDAAGNIYLTGSTRGSATSTPAFPLVNPIQSANAGFDDVWAMKLNPAGAIVYSTLLGGSSFDFGQGIAVDASGQAYVVGTTQSANFPTQSPRQPANGGGGNRDAFLFKLNVAGNGLVFSTYHGGATSDYGTAVALDSSGNAYITGYTDSTNFPLVSARQAVKGWGNDAFVSKLSPSGSTLLYSTYHGGDNADYGNGIAVDRTGAAYIAGGTGSNDFPVLNAFQSVPANLASTEIFVSKFVPAGNAFAYSTLLGGNGNDDAYAIALDAAGNAYVTGHTTSTNLPQVAKLQAASGGDGYDAFIAKVAVVGGQSRLAFSSYLGGSTGRETGRGIAVDRFGGVYAAGEELEPANASLTEVIVAKAAQPMNRAWTGDYDGDGKDDILWRHLSTGVNSIWRSANSTTRITPVAVPDVYWTVAGSGDFNGDNKDDLLWRNLVSGSNDIWLSGNYNTRKPVGGVADTNWVVAGIGDFGGDGVDDILWRNLVTGANSLWNSGNAATGVSLTVVAALKWEIAGVGDFNKDGKADILWRDVETGANAIWRSGNSATLQAVTSLPGMQWRVAQVADFTGDGGADILWRDVANGTNAIWSGGNSATWVAVTTVVTDWRAAGAGDYNGDGKADLLWRNTDTGSNATWGGGAYAARQVITAVPDLAWTAGNP